MLENEIKAELIKGNISMAVWSLKTDNNMDSGVHILILNTTLTPELEKELESIILSFGAGEEAWNNRKTTEEIITNTNFASGNVDVFNFSEALRIELSWLRDNKVISGLDDEDINEIAGEAREGTAGYNSRIVYFEGSWLPYRMTNQPLIKSISDCGGFPLALLPESKTIQMISSPPYSFTELKDSAQVLIKYKQPELNDDDINAVFKEVAPKIKTFDGRKYDKITANLMLESSTMIAQNTWIFGFLFVLEGIRDNKTESWRMDIELIKDGNNNKIIVSNIDGSGTLVPNSYLELSRELAVNNLDKKTLSRTPEIADSRWLVDKDGFVVLKFKDPDGSATTGVTLDLNERRIVNTEKRYWGETFSLSIIEAFVNPQYNMGFYNSGDGLAIFLVIKTDTIYGCSNYKIIANTTKSADRIVVDIKGVQVEQYCDDTLGPAVFSEELGDLKG